MLKQKPAYYILVIFSVALYSFIAYGLHRHDTLFLLTAYTFLFGMYVWVLLKDEKFVEFWLYASILFRVVLLFSIPNLSDDFNRFVWDGRLLANGYHPFAHIPSYYIEHQQEFPFIDAQLFEKLNSRDYFTIYPPVTQFIFWLAAKLFSGSIFGSIVVMRLFHFSAEIGSFWLIIRLLKHYNIPKKNILIYALNPLIILELTGNLHHEGIMIFFLLLSVYLLTKHKLIIAALVFSLAINVKLLPLILLPSLLPWLGWKRAITFYLVTGISTVILFFPLFPPEIMEGFSESLGYYFKKFEFNASIYYLVRQWGYHYYGFNIIDMAGWRLAVISTVLILVYTFVFIPRTLKANLPEHTQISSSTQDLELMTVDRGLWSVDARLWTHFTFILLFYFLFTTTLHPWYIATLIAFSTFTNYRFTVIWSYLIFLTYIGYTENEFHENFFLTAFEYFIVLGYLIFELSRSNFIKTA